MTLFSNLNRIAEVRLVGETSQVRHDLLPQDRHVERPFVTGGTQFWQLFTALNTVLYGLPFSSLINESAKNFGFESLLET